LKIEPFIDQARPTADSADSEKTRSHYDAYPYEVDVRDSSVYRSSQSPVGKFISKIDGKVVLDLGCGPGNVLPAIAGRSSYAVGIDISHRSLRVAANALRNLRVSLVEGNALNLPFPDESFDCVVAAGSIHHTPDPQAAFVDLCRVLRPQGKAFVAVYQAGSYYHFLYHTLGRMARAVERSWIARLIVNRLLLLPVFGLYVLAGRMLLHRRLSVPSYTQLQNYFADQMLNPVVSFHRLIEISKWADLAGVDIVSTATSHAGALINVEICRVGAPLTRKEKSS
jgi:SAM-dependent methyltransferase